MVDKFEPPAITKKPFILCGFTERPVLSLKVSLFSAELLSIVCERICSEVSGVISGPGVKVVWVSVVVDNE